MGRIGRDGCDVSSSESIGGRENRKVLMPSMRERSAEENNALEVAIVLVFDVVGGDVSEVKWAEEGPGVTSEADDVSDVGSKLFALDRAAASAV